MVQVNTQNLRKPPVLEFNTYVCFLDMTVEFSSADFSRTKDMTALIPDTTSEKFPALPPTLL